MADIEAYIEQIAKDGDIQEMIELSDILEDTIKIIKDYDIDKYKEFEIKLYKMAYGDVLTRDMAEKIVNNMRPQGEKWTFEETRDVKNNFGFDSINPIDFYVVMNSAYNDYREIFGENVETYARFTELFIDDEDAKKGKVFIYFTEIPK